MLKYLLTTDSLFSIWASTQQNQQSDCAPSEDSDQPGYFWMSNAYFAVATDSQFDLVFKARDEVTVKTVDRSTFWTVTLSRAFCQKCKQHRLKVFDE